MISIYSTVNQPFGRADQTVEQQEAGDEDHDHGGHQVEVLQGGIRRLK